MIAFHAFGIRFTLPLLTLIMPFLAARLDGSDAIFPVCIALSAHECAHLLAAKRLGVRISEIRIMPFGGSARMENPYRLPAGRLMIVAAAGPIANLLLAICFAAAAHWRLIAPETAANHIHSSLMLLIFNLFPALPLDGGRMLFALLAPRLGERKSIGVCIQFGRLLASGLIFIAMYAFWKGESCNLTLLLAAAFILASAPDERAALSRSHAQRMADRFSGDLRPQPLRLLQMEESDSVHAALRLMRPCERTWFVLARQGIPKSILIDQALTAHLLENGAPDDTLARLNPWPLPAYK